MNLKLSWPYYHLCLCLCGNVCFTCVVSELERIDSCSSSSEFPVYVVCLQCKDADADLMLPGRQEYPLYYEMVWNGFARITHYSSSCLQAGSRSYVKHIWLRYWAFIFNNAFWLILLVLYGWVVEWYHTHVSVWLSPKQFSLNSLWTSWY